jgi:VIT1/CCC1 family predicted Fe2+/Mn2+ transporter
MTKFEWIFNLSIVGLLLYNNQFLIAASYCFGVIVGLVIYALLMGSLRERKEHD